MLSYHHVLLVIFPLLKNKLYQNKTTSKPPNSKIFLPEKLSRYLPRLYYMSCISNDGKTLWFF